MQATDLEIGPIQRTFDDLFQSISLYFNSAPVEPEGHIKEKDLSEYSQDQLRNSLNKSLKHYGFSELPYSIRIVIPADSKISGINRSDDITTYDEKLDDGSHRTFNFYHDKGPENMKVSFYWLDMKRDGEQTQGILTNENRWYLRILTALGNFYYLRMEKGVTKQ